MTKIIIGASEDTEAEYGSRDSRAFSLLMMYDGEIYAVEGFNTFEAALTEAKLQDCDFEIVGRGFAVQS